MKCSYLKELPESVGNLNALKRLDLGLCLKLTALPESLDDLLWRKAREEGGSRMRRAIFSGSRRLVLSPKMKQALELLEQSGTEVIREFL